MSPLDSMNPLESTRPTLSVLPGPTPTLEGVSFVVPVHNGAAFVEGVLDAIARQADGRPMEIVVIDDGSRDRTPEILERWRQAHASADLQRVPWRTRVIRTPGLGAAAALNVGIRASVFPIVCQVDQDVFLRPGWMRRLTEALVDRRLAAAQGYYECDPDAALLARVMNRDLEQRYLSLRGAGTDHVCTGNVAYRADALHAVGLFDESLGYGYDNDLSYRLRAAGYAFAVCPDARSVHRWRDTLAGYFTQQYGFGYGRLDLVAKHPRRAVGDSVSSTPMMAHAPALAAALAGLTVAVVVDAPESRWVSVASFALLSALVLERLVAGIVAAVRFKDPAPLMFPVVHLVRDLAWVTAIAVWLTRRLARCTSRPSHSMRARAPVVVKGLATADTAMGGMSAAVPGRDRVR